MNILDRSLDLSYGMFDPDENKTTHHFSFLFKRNKLIAWGKNYMAEESAKALKIAKIFNIHHFREYPYIHSEIDLLSKVLGRVNINKKIMVNTRLSTEGIRNSRPCENCDTVLQNFNIRLYHTTRRGFRCLRYGVE